MNNKRILSVLVVGLTSSVFGQYAPPAGEPGTTAIAADSSVFIEWASEVIELNRGLEDITLPEGELASFGEAAEAIGMAEGNSTDVVSLGDHGSIVLAFPHSVRNGEGPDFAVFENSFSDTYLEFAHVEVSTDGERFVRFPSYSAVQTETQTGSFGTTLAEEVHNLAGKYRQGYGTPFDLDDLVDSSGIDLHDIQYVKIVDVVGSIDPAYGTRDSEGNLINDPFKTDFESGGFDLDAVGVIHSNNPAAGTDKNSDFEALMVYPNPTKGLVQVKSPFSIKQITAYDLQGKQVLQVNNENQIDLSANNLTEGMYLLFIEDVEGNKSRSKVSVLR